MYPFDRKILVEIMNKASHDFIRSSFVSRIVNEWYSATKKSFTQVLSFQHVAALCDCETRGDYVSFTHTR